MPIVVTFWKTVKNRYFHRTHISEVKLGGREGCGTLVAQLAMRSVMVVIATEVLNDDTRSGQRAELFAVETLVTEASMEALHEGAVEKVTMN
jgi:hypothetical protein